MIANIRHPEYNSSSTDWTLWRDTFEGGQGFIDTYLKQFSSRESTNDFNDRKTMTYCPAFAKAAVNDIKNAIYQRISDVTRQGGPESYQKAINGEDKGVDLKGSTMNDFIGRQIIIELLIMAKVGIFIDRKSLPDRPTAITDTGHPYLYMYKAEDILSWAYSDSDNPWEFSSLLLRDYVDDLDEETLLPKGKAERFRFLYIGNDGYVHVDFYNAEGSIEQQNTLRLTRIPFVTFEISNSLLADVAKYQVALLNIDSSDIAYILKSNFPFYTEQVDPRTQSSHLKRTANTADAAQDAVAAGTTVFEQGSTDDEVTVGAMHGRRYARGSDRPGFIAPPSDPIEASMKKQLQIKEDIRLLVNLSLSNTKSKMASAESKGFDERGLEAGLSYIGVELEHGERQIAAIWAMYEASNKQPTVKYPERYSLKSDKDKMDEAENLEKRMMAIPSDKYKREIAKQIATVMLGNSVSLETLQQIHKEIDSAKILTTDPKVIAMAVENAILSNKGAAKSLGIPDSEVDQAEKDHAARAERILKSQMASRGVNDLAAEPAAGAKDEKKNSQNAATDPEGQKGVRGEGA